MLDILVLVLAFYYLLTLIAVVNKNSQDLKKMEERLSIHKELIGIKADIESMKQRLVKK